MMEVLKEAKLSSAIAALGELAKHPAMIAEGGYGADILSHVQSVMLGAEVALATTRAELAAKDAEIARLQMRLDGLQSLLRDALHYVTKCADMDLADAISCMMVIEHELRAPYNAPECPVSHDGRHHVDTSMESGPNNCFHCEAYMSGKGV